MTEPERSNQPDAGEGEEYDEEPRNPFDNPYFLPILLAGFAIWCGWDGFISDKFKADAFDLWFNRIAFLLLGAMAVRRALKARRETNASSPGSE